MTAGVTIIVERPLGFDEYGDPLPGEPATYEIEGCVIAPSSLREIEDRGREGVVTLLRVFTPAGVKPDILRTDRVRIATGPVAGWYVLDADPFDWTSPFTGREPGFEVSLRRAEG